MTPRQATLAYLKSRGVVVPDYMIEHDANPIWVGRRGNSPTEFINLTLFYCQVNNVIICRPDGRRLKFDYADPRLFDKIDRQLGVTDEDMVYEPDIG